MKKILLALALVASSLACKAQGGPYNMLSSFNLPADTCTNTGTAFLSVRSGGQKEETTIQIVCTKISGTVGGTITVLGSLDGTNYKAATVAEASTALPTFTATDVASQNFILRISKSPYLYYRVSWTGTGTMSAAMSAKLLAH